VYFEISASYLIDFKQTGRHKYEFIEQHRQFFLGQGTKIYSIKIVSEFLSKKLITLKKF
jgi:hypothetical protein